MVPSFRNHLVRVEGLEPTHLAALDPKSSVSTNFTTPAIFLQLTLQSTFKEGSAKINSFFNSNKIRYGFLFWKT
jgi:hypothetical protein